MEAFDPDYICCYYKTGRDIQLSSPQRFREWVDDKLRQERAEEPISDEARKATEKGIANLIFQWEFSLSLEKELKNRLAPFFYNDHVKTAGHSMVAGSLPGYPFTLSIQSCLIVNTLTR
jgi:hypothetical protein